MKSILAKQAPQRSPWLPIRVWQTMQTGGSRRLASVPRTDRTGPVRSRLVPAALMAMAAMIERQAAVEEEGTCGWP